MQREQLETEHLTDFVKLDDIRQCQILLIKIYTYVYILYGVYALLLSAFFSEVISTMFIVFVINESDCHLESSSQIEDVISTKELFYIAIFIP